MSEEANGKQLLDRAFQRELLLQLREMYPGTGSFEGSTEDREKIAANLCYLEGHGLCESGVDFGLDGHFYFKQSRITSRGIDFLADDGGLSAILGVVVVRVHADTIRDLLTAKIDETALPAAEKSAIKRHLAALSEAALRSATTDLIRRGIDHLPDLVTWLRTHAGV